MAADVTANLKLNAEHFRKSIKSAQDDMNDFKGKMKTLSTDLSAALKPAVKSASLLAGAFVAAGAAATAMYGSMLKSGISLNSQIQQAEISFEAFTKSATTAKDIVADLKKEAAVSPFSSQEILGAGKALISTAKGSREELMKLIDTAQILAAMRPDQGLQGAAFAIREAMGGDYKSLQSRFDISRNLIKQLKEQGLEGKELIEAALKSLGAGPDLVEKLGRSYEGLKSTVGDFWELVKTQMAAPVFNELQNGLQRFVDTIGGPDGEKVTDWASQIGEKFGESTRRMVDSLAKFEWESFLDGATKAGEAVALIANKTAEIVDRLSTATYHLMNFVDVSEAISNKIFPALPGSSLVTKYNPIRAFLGQGGKTEGDYETDYARSIARIKARQRGEIIVGDPLDPKNRAKWDDTVVKPAPVKTESVADIIEQQARNSAVVAQRGYALPAERMMMEHNLAHGMGISVDELRRRRASDEANLAKLGVELHVIERNPGHDIMTI